MKTVQQILGVMMMVADNCVGGNHVGLSAGNSFAQGPPGLSLRHDDARPTPSSVILDAEDYRATIKVLYSNANVELRGSGSDFTLAHVMNFGRLRDELEKRFEFRHFVLVDKASSASQLTCRKARDAGWIVRLVDHPRQCLHARPVINEILCQIRAATSYLKVNGFHETLLLSHSAHIGGSIVLDYLKAGGTLRLGGLLGAFESGLYDFAQTNNLPLFDTSSTKCGIVLPDSIHAIPRSKKNIR